MGGRNKLTATDVLAKVKNTSSDGILKEVAYFFSDINNATANLIDKDIWDRVSEEPRDTIFEEANGLSQNLLPFLW